MEKSKIDRINALAKKAKAIGLNERETAERDALRKEYLADMRAAFKQQLDSTYVQTADGAKIPYAEYAKLAEQEGDIVFAGRLGGYKYYDMDKAIDAAFDLVKAELGVDLRA